MMLDVAERAFFSVVFGVGSASLTALVVLAAWRYPAGAAAVGILFGLAVVAGLWLRPPPDALSVAECAEADWND